MAKIKIKEGDWIKVHHYKETIIGYVTKSDSYRAQVKPVRPSSHNNEIIVYTYDSNYEILTLDLDNELVDEMIEMALTIKDEKWFRELVEMKNTNKEKTIPLQ